MKLNNSTPRTFDLTAARAGQTDGGLQSQIESLLASLEDANPTPPDLAVAPLGLQSEIARMLAALPEDSSADTDFELRATPVVASAAKSVKQPGIAQPAREDLFGDADSGAEVLPIAGFVPVPAQRVAADRRSLPAARKSSDLETPATGAGGEPDIGRLILDELEKYSISGLSQLRVAVQGGTATILGEVPGDYERSLVVHFARKVAGGRQVVDMLRVAGSAGTVSRPAVAADARKARAAAKAVPASSRRSVFRLPFRPFHIGAALGLLILVGAGSSYVLSSTSAAAQPVTGSVLYNGAAPEGAVVLLHPVSPGSTVRPKGLVKSNGTFQLTTYQPGDGAPVGRYKLTVEWNKFIQKGGEPVEGPNVLPEKYSQPQTSPVSVTVTWGKNQFGTLKIQK